ncbi:hypothetical protein GCK32_020117 [Trichostrongylus colubriformis]|uniref:Uncharacterized protein n=1 Tax=Trichostrongylus colubriformis TaxID=6319 RepID=A0AAN8IIL6_TRICO
MHNSRLHTSIWYEKKTEQIGEISRPSVLVKGHCSHFDANFIRNALDSPISHTLFAIHYSVALRIHYCHGFPRYHTRTAFPIQKNTFHVVLS